MLRSQGIQTDFGVLGKSTSFKIRDDFFHPRLYCTLAITLSRTCF